ncbi:hypothetical protein [Metallosphaera sp.]|uniref:hypothetical protein n=1 Tax=Metallosphaera sp. TaxID=2020860 RepID=UPI0038620EDE
MNYSAPKDGASPPRDGDFLLPWGNLLYTTSRKVNSRGSPSTGRGAVPTPFLKIFRDAL